MPTTKNVGQILQSSIATPEHKRVIGAKLYRYCLPLTAPLDCNHQRLTERNGLVIALHFSDGNKGYGEVAPLPGFSAESLADCTRALRHILPKLIAAPQYLFQRFAKLPPSAAFGLDCALCRIPFRYSEDCCGVPLLLGDAVAIMAKYQQLGCPALVKLKVARQPVAEEAQLVGLLIAKNPQLKINFDANQGWTLAEANQFMTLIPTLAVGYIEEPCADLVTSLQFAEYHGIGVALDETLQNPDFEFVANKYIKALVIKPSLVGGFSRCLAFIELAARANIGCYLSSSYESSLGISQLQHLARQWTPGQVNGFDTLAIMQQDLLAVTHTSKALLPLAQLDCIFTC